jgi:hypothetical protein
MMQRHAIADLETTHLASHAHNRPRGFVPKDAGRRNGSVLDFLYVSRTDATNSYFDQQLTRPDARNGHRFHAKIIHTAVNNRANGFWQAKHGKSLNLR